LSVGVAGWPDGRVKEASFGSVDVGLRLSELVRALVSELVSQTPIRRRGDAHDRVYGAGLLSQVNGRVADSCGLRARPVLVTIPLVVARF